VIIKQPLPINPNIAHITGTGIGIEMIIINTDNQIIVILIERIIIIKARMITMIEEKEIMIMIKTTEKVAEEVEVETQDPKIKRVVPDQEVEEILVIVNMIAEMATDPQVVIEISPKV